MAASAHLRGIVIAGALAALALALAFVTLAMNQTASRASDHTVLTLKARHHAAAAAKPVHRAKPDPNFTAALAGGLPRSVAKALAASPVAIVELTSKQDPVAQLAYGEAQAGAALGGASFVSIDIDHDGGDIATLTRLIGQLPDAPAALVYERPASLFVSLPGFNDRTTVQQAAANAALTATGGAALAAAPDWATRAGVLCRQASTQIGAMGGTARPAKLAAHKVKFEAVATGFLAQLKALTPPAGKVAQAGQLNTLLAKSFAAEDAMVAAASMHHPAELAAAKTRATSYQTQIDKLERRLGATGCAELAA